MVSTKGNTDSPVVKFIRLHQSLNSSGEIIDIFNSSCEIFVGI